LLLSILLFCGQSIWKCVNFFLWEKDWIGLDWIGRWPSSCVIACSSACPKVSNQKPNETMGFGCRLLIRPCQKTFLWTKQKVGLKDMPNDNTTHPWLATSYTTRSKGIPN
jgi:hypothetical protein